MVMHLAIALRPGAARCVPNVLRAWPRRAPSSIQSLLPPRTWRAHLSTTTQRHEAQQNHTRKASVERDDAQRKVDDRPWQRASNLTREEADTVKSQPGDDYQGCVLTTPTRLLKLIIPMPFHPEQKTIDPENELNKDQSTGTEKVEPLALLVHPQQPLSYVERLIQAEIPPLIADGREKLPGIVFRAEAEQDKDHKKAPRNGDNVATYSGLGHEGPRNKGHVNWVRWSGSTEVGDFIRDAARGREFEIEIEGCPQELRIRVPSFNDRTYYMRVNLRRMSRRVDRMAKIKNECDQIAHRGAHRLAQGGFAALVGWWGVVYYVTFHTEMGWDLVEPVTYLAGLTTIMGGYLWFLFISRDLSYKAAMNITVSRRQHALYQEKGFDQGTWDQLIQEVNLLRREVRIVASEYGVEWDETKDLGGEEVKEVLEQEKNKNKRRDDEDDEDDEGGHNEKGDNTSEQERAPETKKPGN
ncbi:unnamed protein product [Clonostachys solani]|uniref:Calcium uniporter protein n=1 Tax=Clonostachys solani TaxID=160281 RepID=A0A9P0EGL0_9HYPO|nr:unnamed protein product [Clonostachys solani]